MENGIGSSATATGAELPESRAGRRWFGFAAATAGLAILIGASFAGYSYLNRRSQTRTRADAVEEYRIGRELWRQRHADSIVKAIEHYERAAALDPSYAPAYSGLADAYLASPLYSSIPKNILFPKALEAAKKAVAADPMLPEAHISLADAKFYSEDLAGADPEYRRGIELNPNYATGPVRERDVGFHAALPEPGWVEGKGLRKQGSGCVVQRSPTGCCLNGASRSRSWRQKTEDGIRVRGSHRYFSQPRRQARIRLL